MEVKAKKEHRCGVCTDVIPKGEIYDLYEERVPRYKKNNDPDPWVDEGEQIGILFIRERYHIPGRKNNRCSLCCKKAKYLLTVYNHDDTETYLCSIGCWYDYVMDGAINNMTPVKDCTHEYKYHDNQVHATCADYCVYPPEGMVLCVLCGDIKPTP